MVPQTQRRKPKNSSKVNLIISLTFHTLIVLALVYFAAREGAFGEKIKKLAVSMVKEKPPEKPKEPEKPKVEPPKVEPPKVEPPKVVDAPKPIAAPPPAVAAPPVAVAAPPAVDIPAFDFGGGRTVQTGGDPVQAYKGLAEASLRTRWTRPDGIDDAKYVAEIDLSVDRSGQLSNPVWKKSSGNKKWDDSVQQAIKATPVLSLAPPTNFPSHMLVRFDVQEVSEPIVP